MVDAQADARRLGRFVPAKGDTKQRWGESL